MSHLFWLTGEQVEQLAPFFPKSRGVGRADDCKVLSGSIYVIKKRAAMGRCPPDYGLDKTLYNRFKRWSGNSVFERIFEALAKPHIGVGNVFMIKVTHLKVHRTASCLKKGR